MKRILIILLLCVFIQKGFSQQDSEPFINGYLNKEYIYFDSLNKLWRNEIACFDITHEVYASFRIDTNSNVVDLKITELPVYSLPIEMKAYIEKLIISTNGKWVYKINNQQKSISNEIIYRFDFFKPSKTMQERLDATIKLMDCYYDYAYNLEVIKKFDNMKAGKIFSIGY